MTQTDYRSGTFDSFPAVSPRGQTDAIETIDFGRTVLLLIDVYHAAEAPAAQELVHTFWIEFWRIVDDRLVPLVDRGAGSAGCRSSTR